MIPSVVHSPKKMFELCESRRREGVRVGFVPTMGSLHEGHLSLVDLSGRVASCTVVSIFVNPTQFCLGEDFEAYPRNLDADLEKLSSHGVDAVFAPSAAGMYPGGFSTEVFVAGLTFPLCGAHRPGHFNGVTTVVAKLLNIVGPCAVVLGRKDYQQLKVIEKMVLDLNMPVEVVQAPTVREQDGLAMSSRNAYLSSEERRRALSISRGLKTARWLFSKGERRAEALRDAALREVTRAMDKVDYVEVADPDTLNPLGEAEHVRERALLAVAARIGRTRLIDNTVLGEDEAI